MPQIEGAVEDVVFRNEDNGFTVLTLRCGRERVSAVGVIGAVSPGETLRITGEWVEHPDYGRQIKISAWEGVKPTTISGIERYLGSGAIRGVGPATAKLIVHAFGQAALDVMDETPGRLTEIDGIGPKRAAMIAQSYREQRAQRGVMVFLQGYGISPALALKIYKAFGDATEHVVRSNPYMLVEKVQGVGFKTADGIAYSLGVERESPARLRCALEYVLGEAVNSAGHTYLPRERLAPATARLLGVDEELVETELTQLVIDGRLIQSEVGGETRVYLPALYQAEQETAFLLCRLTSVDMRADPEAVDRHVERYERRGGMTLCREQRDAVRAAASGAVCIITGGPGTGKTTGIRCIIEWMENEGTVELCAPTGRAARRMTEATGRAARTIHRLLEYAGEEGAFQKNRENPLDADCVIVDEMSMVDIFLMRSLLWALRPGTRLVLVGDADQLPSVGAGNVLRDLIDSDVFPVVKLTEIFRQDEKSAIVLNAHRINQGLMPVMNRPESDFFLERALTAQQAARSVLSLARYRLPNYLGLNALRDIQVMAPMKKGDAGVWQLNLLLQDALNPKSARKAELPRERATLREGDKVMQTRNNYQLAWTRGDEEGTGIFNGDIGFITRIDPEERAVYVRFDDERECVYAEADLEDLELSYCMSVHKSQGSEFEAVVLPLLSGPSMLFTRNLLYTAVTRAKRMVVLVGREDCVRAMVNNNHVSARYSALGEYLQQNARLGGAK